MYNYGQSNDLKIRPVPRVEKPVVPFPRNPVNFLRRPSFPLRRRFMSGRYPNLGFRPFGQSGHRPEYPVPRGVTPDFRFHSSPIPTAGVAPPAIQRPPFPRPPSTFDNRSNQFPLPPRSNAMSGSETQMPAELPERRKESQEFNVFSDLWVEALAVGGKKYYYNARTREAIWDRPVNARIIDLDEIKHLRTCSGTEYPQNSPKENQNHFVQHQPPPNPYGNSFIPRNFPAPPALFMFPPPPNLCNPPPILPLPSTEHMQDTPVCAFNAVIAPPMFSVPLATRNFFPANETGDYNANITFGEVNQMSEHVESQTFIDNKDLRCSEDKISDWSTPECKMSLCTTSNVEEINSSDTVDESMVEQNAVDLSIVKTENELLQTPKSEDLQSVETDCLSSESPVEIKNEELQNDKSRPVSSTPVSGTCWHVVWTGDDKVFFFDSQRRVSVWDRPSELVSRTDVDKLTKISPLYLDLKFDKKEVRKTTSDGSDVIKKLKIEEKDDEIFTEEIPAISIVKDDMPIIKDEEKVKLEEIPHEEKVKMFCEMLAEKKVSAFSAWEKELHKIIYDSRYLLLPSKERRQVFEAYVVRKLEEEKYLRQKEFLSQREKFRSLLEEAGITSKSRFSDFAQRYGKDIRFKSVDKIKQRESIFNQYVSEVAKKDRENEKLKTEQRRNFIELLNEQKFSSKDITWSEVQKRISNDERYKAIQSNSSREKIFKEYIRGRVLNVSRNEKEERINFSIRNREDEVKRDLEIHLKNREREQELHKHKSAVSDFKALLNDLIRHSDISWHSAKKILKEDHRWGFVQCLESETREELYDQHIDSLNAKKKHQFHNLLEEITNITLKSSWLDIRKIALKDARCVKFSTSERKCEKEFKEYLRQKILTAKSDFKELLKETKFITYRSKFLLDNTNHLKDIEETLAQDQRYLNLDCIRSERSEILLSYINKLHDEGPPPPPTASEPANRLKIGK